MKRYILALSFILLICAPLFAQVEDAQNKGVTVGLPEFFIDMINYKGTDIPGKTRVDAFIQVPNANIQFVKSGLTFEGGYTITMTFMDENKDNVVFETSWKESITAQDFEQTTSPQSFNMSYRKFNFKPGKYFFKCVLEDNNSKQVMRKEAFVTVKDLTDSLSVSDIMLIAQKVNDNGKEKIIPNVSRILNSRDSTLVIYYEIYSDKPRSIMVDYVLNDKTRDKSDTKMVPVELKEGTNKISYTIPYDKFTLGDYTLGVQVKDENLKTVTETEKNMFATVRGLPHSIKNLDKAIEQLVYIASPAQIQFIREAKTYEDKLQRFVDFWKSKNSSDDLENNPIIKEYYRRIEYANRNFRSYYEGWRSDMGLIFVTFGPPSAVDRHPVDMGSKPYEIWEYYELNKQFLFVDETGFGDYHLVNPDYSRWGGYRQ